MIAVSDKFVATDKLAVAKELAKKHFELEEGLTRIFRIIGKTESEVSPAEPIRLLEVNENTVPCGVMPLRFGPVPASGIRYSSVIVEVTPEEFKKIEMKELKLPEGWENWEELPRPQESAGAA